MILSLPDHRQQSDWSCGRALLEAFHLYWNLPLKTSLARLSNPVQGMGPDTMDAALRAAGFEVVSGSMTLKMLKGLTGQGYPVGCLVQYEDCGHWVLVGGIQRNRVHFLCPIRGLISESVDVWRQNWRDSHWLGGEFHCWGTVPFIEE